MCNILDFGKAFELVLQNILSKKLALYTISKAHIIWIMNWLTSQSSQWSVYSWVLKGSVVGTMLFNNFTDELEVNMKSLWQFGVMVNNDD